MWFGLKAYTLDIKQQETIHCVKKKTTTSLIVSLTSCPNYTQYFHVVFHSSFVFFPCALWYFLDTPDGVFTILDSHPLISYNVYPHLFGIFQTHPWCFTTVPLAVNLSYVGQVRLSFWVFWLGHKV